MKTRPSLSRSVLSVYAYGLIILMLIPMAALVPISLGDSATMSALPEHFSLRWYREVLGGSQWRESFSWSLITAGLATLISTAIGYLGAYLLVHSTSKMKGVLEIILLMPVMVPTVIVAFSTYILSNWMPADSNWLLIAVGQALLGLPIATLIIAAGLRDIDVSIIRAAVSLGGQRHQVFLWIILPMARHGILSAAALGFLIAFDELLVAIFLTKPGLETLPVRIYDAVTYELTPAIAVVSVFLMALIALALIVGNCLKSRGTAKGRV
ncbi:ABC transporter permease [Sodalis sp. RH15]|uniref:ABC transporter permease n=1 Tax=Sodalis sp. RH15 TaxID=3394330 RepID=UPI0039B4534F